MAWLWGKPGSVSLLETMQATGLSRTYCGMIRRGVRIPHPRHWEALRELVRSSGDLSEASDPHL